MKFRQGETASFKATYMNVDGDIIDPSETGVYVYDPKGNEAASGTPSKVEDGIYRYNYDILSDAIAGDWEVEFTGTVSGMKVIVTEPFRVIER